MGGGAAELNPRRERDEESDRKRLSVASVIEQGRDPRSEDISPNLNSP